MNDDYSTTLETEREDLRVRVILDQYADENDNPRQYDNLGVMACVHRSYDLGDTDNAIRNEVVDALERTRSLEVVSRWLRIYHGSTVILPLGLIDHSGISMYVGGGAHACDPGGWDSGTVGIIFDTAETREMTGLTTDDDIARILADEVTEYDKYLTGEVYGYVIETTEDDEELESCWGMLGYEWAKESALHAYKYLAKTRPLQLTFPGM